MIACNFQYSKTLLTLENLIAQAFSVCTARAIQRTFEFGFFLASVCASTCASADVFQYIAEDGTSHFSDQPTDSRFRLLMRIESKEKLIKKMTTPIRSLTNGSNNLAKEITAAAFGNQIEPALLHAVIEIESGYNANAISPKGAMGLMQLMPDTARRYGVVDPMNATQNLQGGARLLRDLLDQFAQNKELALAAYNAGPGAVMAHGRRIPPYPETIRYVPAVLRSYALRRAEIQPLQN